MPLLNNATYPSRGGQTGPRDFCRKICLMLFRIQEAQQILTVYQSAVSFVLWGCARPLGLLYGLWVPAPRVVCTCLHGVDYAPTLAASIKSSEKQERPDLHCAYSSSRKSNHYFNHAASWGLVPRNCENAVQSGMPEHYDALPAAFMECSVQYGPPHPLPRVFQNFPHLRFACLYFLYQRNAWGSL